MENSIKRPQIPIINIEIATPAKVGKVCFSCDEPMSITSMSHERWLKRVVIHTDDLPSYSCEECDLVEPDMDAAAEFLTKAIESVGSRRATRFLQQELNLINLHRQPSEPA